MKFLNEKAINRVTEKSRWNLGKFYSIGRGTFERDKEDRKLRQNIVIRPRKEGISRRVLKAMASVAEISRTGTEKRPLDLVRSLHEILQSGGCGSQVRLGRESGR